MNTHSGSRLIVVSLIVGGLLLILAQGILAASVEPILMPGPGNQTCADLGYAIEYKVDPPQSGTFMVPEFGSITVTMQGELSFDWTSTFGIDAVIAKGGNQGANAFVYDPESLGDTNLYVPDGEQAVSHISFCYDLDEVPPTEIPPTEIPPTEVPPTEVPPTEVPPTEVPPTEVPPTPTLQIIAQPEDPTATPVPQDNPTEAPTSAPTVAPTATPEPLQAVLPAAGTGSAAGGFGGLISIAFALAGGAAAWWRKSRI
ncbi:MAG: hypothetical protein R6X16_09625 [Anaerolineae bacterium]